MKTLLRLSVILLLTLALVFAFCACNDTSTPEEQPNDKPKDDNEQEPEAKTTYSVSFGEYAPSQEIEKGKSATKPQDPERNGYKFVGWYTESGESYDFSSSVHGNTVIVAKFELIEYTITYVLGDGTIADGMPSTYTVESPEITLLPAVKAGYEFTSWTAEDGFSVNVIPTGSIGNITLKANYTAKNYSISYETNGGINDSRNPTSYTPDDETQSLYEPTRSGFNFIGWYTESSFKNAVTEIVKGSYGELRLYAKWSADSYGISYILEGGTNNSDNPNEFTFDEFGESQIQLLDPERKGYTFEGWYSDAQRTQPIYYILTSVASTQTVYAKWDIVDYNINYNLGVATGGDNPATYTVDDEDIILESPTLEGYDFEGWYTSLEDGVYSGQITAIDTDTATDIDLYPKWSIHFYAINYTLYDGDNDPRNEASYTVNSSVTELYSASKDDYNFVGWYSEDGFINRVYTYGGGTTGEINLYAQFTIKVYDIFYNTDEGTLPQNYVNSFTHLSDSFSLPTPERAGYAFLGWYTSEIFTEETKIESVATGTRESLTLYAKWELQSYTVHYHNLDEAKNSEYNPASYGAKSNVYTIYDAEKSGYNFIGWYESYENGVFSNKFDHFDTSNPRELNLYAKFEIITYTITYVDTEVPEGVKTSYTVDDEDFELYVPERENYVFYGWYENPEFNGTNVTTVTTSSLSNYTFYPDLRYIFSYTLNEDNEATLTGYLGNETALTLPEFVNGYEVSELGFYFRAENRTVSELIIPSYVEKLAEGSLSALGTELKKLTLPEVSGENYPNVNTLFNGVDGVMLEELTVTGGEELTESALAGLRHLTKLSLPDTLVTIGAAALGDLEKLTEISIPDGVTSIGERAFSGMYLLESCELPAGVTRIENLLFNQCSSLTDITVNGAITYIGDYAFCDSGITSFSVGKEVESIGESAFSGCASLRTLTIEAGSTLKTLGADAFRDCSSLSELHLPSGIEKIYSGSLYGCSALEELTVPYLLTYETDGVTAHGTLYDFFNDNIFSNLKTVTVLGGKIGDEAFKVSDVVSVTLPSGITEIGAGAFAYCMSLTTVSIPNGVSTVGDEAFISCTSLKSINIPASVTFVGTDAFSYAPIETVYAESLDSWYGIDFENLYANPLARNKAKLMIGGSELTELTSIPEYVTEIKQYAFAGASGLAKAEIPATVNKIGIGAFYNCEALTDISLHFLGESRESEDKTLSHLFAYSSISSGTESVSYMTNLPIKKITLYEITDLGQILPSSVSGNAIEYITLPDTLVTIGDNAFWNCNNLKELYIPEGVKSIGEGAFTACGNLYQVYIPKSVEAIPMNLFNDCTHLTRLYYEGTSSEWEEIGGALSYGNIEVLYMNYSADKEDWVSVKS